MVKLGFFLAVTIRGWLAAEARVMIRIGEFHLLVGQLNPFQPLVASEQSNKIIIQFV